MTEDQNGYAERIAKLLRKAEATDNEAEAEAFTNKAQQLMIKYAVSEEMLDAARGLERKDTIIRDTIEYHGIFHMALYKIGMAIADHNDVKGLIYKPRGLATHLILVGYSRDVERVRLLDASIQLQANVAMRKWYRTQNTKGYTPMDKSIFRRQFFFSYAQGVDSRLREARRLGVAEAEKETGMSSALVLRDKGALVDAAVANMFGRLGYAKDRYKRGNRAAAEAGYAAGRNADVGQPRVGSRRGIGS
jgi:hypothetical protein